MNDFDKSMDKVAALADNLQTGTCRYCKQVNSFQVDASFQPTMESLDEQATLHCECDEAVIYAEKMEQKERAKKRVQELFGETAGDSRATEDTINFMLRAVELVCDSHIKVFNVEIRGKVRVKIAMSGKEKIIVERTETDKVKYEE